MSEKKVNVEKLKEKIARLEEQFEKNRFGPLFERRQSDKDFNRIKKLKKELKLLEDGS